MKKTILSLAVLALLISCKDTSKHKKCIAITQIVNHPSLNEAKRGMMDNLPAEYKIMESDAQGDVMLAQQIAQRIVSQSVDLVVAISTPSAQALQKASEARNIPVLFCSVTYPNLANLVKNYEKPEKLTGVYDAPVIEDTLKLAQKMLPSLKTIGIIYNPSEVNSDHTVRELKEKAGSLVVKVVPVHNSSEIVSAIQFLAGRVDMIYVPSDNTVWPSLETLTQVAKRAGIPVFSSDPDSAKRGVTVALGYAQYDLGVAIAKQVQSILEDGKSVSDVPVQRPDNIKMYVNQAMAAHFQLTIPADLPYEITHVKE